MRFSVAARWRAQGARLVERFEQRAFDLAAAGPLHRAPRWDHHFVDLESHALHNAAAHLDGQLGCRELALGFHDDHDALALAAAQPADAERHDVARAHTGELTHGPLEVFRIKVLAVDDHDVLLPSANVQVAVGQIAFIAGVQPALAQRTRGGVALLEVPLHHRGTARHDFAHGTLRQG